MILWDEKPVAVPFVAIVKGFPSSHMNPLSRSLGLNANANVARDWDSYR
jgi:hypothetical protein